MMPCSKKWRSLVAKHEKYLWLGLLITLFGIWSPALSADFFWDDRALVLGNSRLGHLSTLFTQDLGSGSEMATPFFRPLFMLSLAFDQWLWPENPVGYHAQSLLWHLSAVAALGWLLRPHLGAERSLIAAMIFGLHPLQSEAVLWISARSDLMCAALVFLGLGAFDRNWRGLGILSVLLAGLAKEQGMLLPLALLLWQWEKPLRAKVISVGLASLAVGGVVLLRSQAQLLSVSPDPDHLSLFLSRWPLLLTHSLGWLLWPWPLSSSASLYQPLPGPIFVALLSALFLGIAGWRAPRPLLIALLFWTPTWIAVAATTLIGERYLYLPLGFLAILPAMLSRRWLPMAALGAGLALIALALRLPQWQSEATLVEAAWAASPDPYLAFRLGLLREEQGDPKAAFSAYLQAVHGDPPFLAACVHPLQLLSDVNAEDKARQLAQELAPLCASRHDFARAYQDLNAPSNP